MIPCEWRPTRLASIKWSTTIRACASGVPAATKSCSRNRRSSAAAKLGLRLSESRVTVVFRFPHHDVVAPRVQEGGVPAVELFPPALVPQLHRAELHGLVEIHLRCVVNENVGARLQALTRSRGARGGIGNLLVVAEQSQVKSFARHDLTEVAVVPLVDLPAEQGLVERVRSIRVGDRQVDENQCVQCSPPRSLSPP